jgi:cytochrome P450
MHSVAEAVHHEIDQMLVSRQFLDDPYPVYKILRESDPVHWSDAWGVWLLTRYDDVVKVLRDPGHFSSVGRFSAFLDQLPADVQAEVAPLRRHYSGGLIQSDPPNHTRLRGLLRQAFTPRVIEGMRDHVQSVVNGLIDRVAGSGHMDVVNDLAYPLPVMVVSTMLGAGEVDHERLFRWTADIGGLQATGGARAENARRASESMVDIEEYFRGIVADHRATPRNDLVSHMIAAQDAGDQLTDDELISNCVTLLLAGHESTKYTITNGVLTLLRHPEQLNALKQDSSLLPTAIEEILRYESPIQRGWRLVAEDIDVHGRTIRKGQLVYYMFGAANRDPEQFPEPDNFDIGRQSNRHVAFGFGIHFCIGAPLARIEAPIAIETILRRLDDLELKESSVQWGDSVHVRGPKKLEIGFRAIS